MPNADNRKVFVSYGRSDASDLAGELLKALQENGYEPWRDTREIPAGSPWTEPIQQGLEDSGACVAILSPHSVRTFGSTEPGGEAQGDSVCLNEVHAAIDLKKPIVPAMAFPCAAPFLINHLDYVDFTHWKESAEKLQTCIERLVAGLKDALAGKLHYRPWYRQLRPMDFSAFLSSRRKEFVGRTWLFDELLKWAKDGVQSTLLIVGDPGIGKSAIVAELVHRNPDGRILAYHCCRANVGETLDPGRFVRNLAAMIAGRVPAYASQLELPELRRRLNETACAQDPEGAFELGIVEPLQALGSPDDAPLLVIVDALDEALLGERRRGVTIVDLLRNLHATCPTWLRLVATTRKEKPVLEALAAFKPQILKAHDPRNRRDIEDYVKQRLRHDPLHAALAASGRSENDVARLVRKGARGNFLYARHALDALELPGTDIDDLDALPPGLANQYEWFFDRQFPTEAVFAPVRELLQTLVVTQRPLDEDELELLTDLDRETQLATALRTLSAYVAPEEDDDIVRYRIFHRSLSDWLTKPSRRGALHSVSRAIGHERVADRLWAAYEDDPEDLGDYSLTHLATHLGEVARKGSKSAVTTAITRLMDFVLDPTVQEQRRDDPLGMVRSLELALAVASEQRRRDVVTRIARSAWGLAAYRRTRLDPQRLFDMARGGDLVRLQREVDLYPVERPWREASLLTAAWLAARKNESGARALRNRVAPFEDEPRLVARLDAALDGPEYQPADTPPAPSPQEIETIMVQIRGTDLERFSGMAEGMVDPDEVPRPGDLTARAPDDDELPALLARHHARPLIGHAIAAGKEGTRTLREYVALQAANSYRVYRNRSLWPIFQAALEHPDEAWALELLPTLCAAALAGGTPEFREAAPIALRALDASRSAAEHDAFAAALATVRSDAAALAPFEDGKGDAWGAHRRRLGAYAEALACVLGERATAEAVVADALDLPYGYAGFNAPASLTVAESARVAGCAPDVVEQALRNAQAAAHNVQDPTFCARTTSRCHALRHRWWRDDGAFDAAAVTERFVAEPNGAEFAALHLVGWDYDGRNDQRGKQRLPAWVREAQSLREFATVYQQPLSGFLELNRDIAHADEPLTAGREVCVPDGGITPLLAARFAAELLVSTDGSTTARTRRLQRLVPIAAASETTLDTALARLLLLARPTDHASIAAVHDVYRVVEEKE